MTEQTARAGDLVDGGPRGGDLVVGEEIPRRIVEGCAESSATFVSLSTKISFT